MSTHSIFSNEIAVFQLETWGQIPKAGAVCATNPGSSTFRVEIWINWNCSDKCDGPVQGVTTVRRREPKRRNQKLLEHS